MTRYCTAIPILHVATLPKFLLQCQVLGCTMCIRTAVNPQTQGAVKNALFLKTCARQGSNTLDRKCMINKNFTAPAP